MRSELWWKGLFFAFHRCRVITDLGETLVVQFPSGKQDVVLKSEVDTQQRADECGFWTSREKWADRHVADEEEWAATLQQRVDEIDTEIEALRAERERDAYEAREKAESAREWRRTLIFEETTK